MNRALDFIREGEHLLQSIDAKGVGYGRTYIWLGRASFLLGRFDEASSFANRIARSLGASGSAAHARHLLGDIATHADRFDAESGEVHYREALAIAQPRGMRPLIGHCHLGLGTLYRRTGKDQQALEHLTIATTMYREMGMTYWLDQSQAEMRPLRCAAR